MDNHRFDNLTKRLYALTNRRQELRVLLASLAAAITGVSTADEAAAHCKRRGALCRHGGECCSLRCRNRKHLKKKNGERTKQKIGRCDCSNVQQHCHVADDCCDPGQACGDTGCDEHPVCCKPAGAECDDDDCDCCGDNVCGESGLCEQPLCADVQEACEFTSECCPDLICDKIDDECEPEAEKVCCAAAGGECEEDCDCCVPFQCQIPDGEDVGECAAPCSNSGQPCIGPSGPIACCSSSDICFTSALCNGAALQAEVLLPVCCRTSGPCNDHCECCGSLGCVKGVCAGLE